MAAIKLKVGDRVRLYRKDKTSRWEVGHLGVVVGVSYYYVDVRDTTGTLQIIYPYCLAHA